MEKIIPNHTFKLTRGKDLPNEMLAEVGEITESNREWGIMHIKAHEVWENYDIKGEDIVIGIMDMG